MKKNDIFYLEITDLGVDGEGIGHAEGMTFFVKDALPGDTIEARCLKLKKNYGYARVEKVVSPSPHRIVPECPVARTCGGCQIQALSYESQLEFKFNKVKNNLLRLGGLSEEELSKVLYPIVGMESPFRYRNKAQFPFGYDREGNIAYGFFAARSHALIPVDDCLLGVEGNEEILYRIRQWMEGNEIAPYDETTGQGLIRHVLLRYGFTSGEWMVCLIINGTKLPAQDQLLEMLTDRKGMTSISININKENTNRILGDKTICIWGQPYISDTIALRNATKDAKKLCKNGEFASECSPWEAGGSQVEYHISPQSFYQVNPVQTEKLYSTALEFAGLTGEEYVWDLYCGIGTISLFLSQKAKQVYGVEIIPQAIEDAKENARINGIENAQFFVGKAEEVLPEFYASAKKDSRMLRPDVIVVDPPRKGCDEACLNTMVQMQPDRIVYVSCDSATLARDIKYLTANGYGVRKVQAFDQFGNTVHVECIVCIQRKK